MSPLAPRRGSTSSLPLLLVALALAMRIAAPPGTMVAPSPAGARLIICTGHGPLAAGEP
ncbi:MAG: hypothetical protein JOZ27_01395, partial [Caulobacteraceae bacterium]|nr:hypothetical protein [Caulobacteraceae bacterium]